MLNKEQMREKEERKKPFSSSPPLGKEEREEDLKPIKGLVKQKKRIPRQSSGKKKRSPRKKQEKTRENETARSQNAAQKGKQNESVTYRRPR